MLVAAEFGLAEQYVLVAAVPMGKKVNSNIRCIQQRLKIFMYTTKTKKAVGADVLSPGIASCCFLNITSFQTADAACSFYMRTFGSQSLWWCCRGLHGVHLYMGAKMVYKQPEQLQLCACSKWSTVCKDFGMAMAMQTDKVHF